MSCTNHGAEACCFACLPEDIGTDGCGFPHPRDAKGLVPVRHCQLCGRFVPREQWRSNFKAARYGCETCVPDGTPAGPFPRRVRA